MLLLYLQISGGGVGRHQQAVGKLYEGVHGNHLMCTMVVGCTSLQGQEQAPSGAAVTFTGKHSSEASRSSCWSPPLTVFLLSM